ncbi:MAG: glycerate kinase [Acidobacteriota bacterium]
MKEALQRIFLQTLDKLALDRLIPEQLSCSNGILKVGNERLELRDYENIVAVALGKAAFQMAAIVADILSPVRLTGLISGVPPRLASAGSPDAAAGTASDAGGIPTLTSTVGDYRGGNHLQRFARFYGGHPYPNADSFAAADAVIKQLRRLTPHDLVLYLLSGGGSSICERPISETISLPDCQQFYELLVTCGVNILDVNFVRKHFSAVKGGRLTELAYPARQLTIYVSDAPPDSPSNVASGPTMADESTVEDCYRIVRSADLTGRLPASIRSIFEKREIPETPKPGAEIFRTSSWHCLLSPEEAVAMLGEEASGQGWLVEVDLSVRDDCPLERATTHLLRRLQKLRLQHPGQTVAIVSGGEYSCPVTGDGRGGRNQAFVLDCVARIAGRNIAVLSAGSDGVDGTSPAAGAVADGSTLARARQTGLDPDEYARRSDSYGFFSELGDALITGPTGNNIRDLRILAAW